MSTQPFSQEDLRRILELLGIEDEERAEQALSRIYIALQMFAGMRSTGMERFGTRKARDVAARELLALSDEINSLRRRLDDLGVQARGHFGKVALKQPKAWDGSLAYKLSYRGRELEMARQDVVELLDSILLLTEGWAKEEAATLKGPATGGRRRDSSGRFLVEQLAAIWEEFTSRPIRLDLRGKGAQAQPFAELVATVGKSVDRDFKGAGAIRRFYDWQVQQPKREE